MNAKKKIWSRLAGQFGRPTGVWGALAGFIMSHRPSNRKRNDWTLELLEIQPEHSVLEIGFGPGLGIQGAAERARRGRVFGIDHSEVMLKQASRRNAAALSAGRVFLRCASVNALPEFPENFDRIFGANVHMFWSDVAGTVASLHELLRPGGILALTFQPRNPGATNSDALKAGAKIMRTFEDAGLENPSTEVLEISPSAVCVMGQRSAGENAG